MIYVVKVVGYNCYWTGDKTPGKLWSNNLSDAKKFTKELDAINVIYTGRNMQVVEYEQATQIVEPIPPNWSRLDEESDRMNEVENKRKTSGIGFGEKSSNVIVEDLGTEEFNETIIKYD